MISPQPSFSSSDKSDENDEKQMSDRFVNIITMLVTYFLYIYYFLTAKLKNWPKPVNHAEFLKDLNSCCPG